MGKTKKLSIEYIAGFYDGEGHISIVRRRKKGRDNFNYTPQVNVCNTDLRIINMIRDVIGGRFVKVINISSYSKRPFMYRILITNLEACKHVLELLMPYLVIKKDVAKLVHSFCVSRLNNINNHVQTGKGRFPKYNEYELGLYSEYEKIMPRGHLINGKVKDIHV